MSAFLAPIHTWVFNKIKYFESLENNLVNSFKTKYGGEIEEIVEISQKRFGRPLEDRPVEELIDTSNIHGWLQSRIEAAETREAYLLTEILNKYGKLAQDLALEVYRHQGSEAGTNAKSNYLVETAPELYKAMNNYLLDGMPCDIVNTVTLSNNERHEWENVICLHKGYWDSVGADSSIFYELRSAWIKSFIENANAKYTYNVSTADIDGQTGFIHQIVRK